MRVTAIASGLFSFLLCTTGGGAERPFTAPAEKKRNNLVAELLHASSISEPSAEFTFTRATEGWVFISVTFKGTGTSTSTLDPASRRDAVIVHEARDGQRAEAVRYVA